MLTLWKESFGAHKTTIQFCNNTYMPLQKLTQKMQKAYCLAIITILKASSSSLLNTICIWKILQKCRIVMQTCTQQVLGGSEPIPKF
jgi:hypothetical protein